MENFTIVIATAIRPTLSLLLETINRSTVLPKEVIISIPKNKKYFLDNSNYQFKIKIISKGVGQVKQRIEGFKVAKTPLCIQMDDDITFEKSFLEKLINSFVKLPYNSALAPSFIVNKTPFSVLISPKPTFAPLLYFILDGKFKPNYGEISKSGIPFGINPIYSKNDESLVKTSWIPGACVIHRTPNLLTDWKYPYSGKAYAEDLMHSYLLKAKKIELFIERSLILNLELDESTKKLNVKNYIFSRFPLYRALVNIPNLRINTLRYLIFSIVYLLIKTFDFLKKQILKIHK